MTRHHLCWGVLGGILLVVSGWLWLLAQSAAPSAYRFVALELLAGLVYLLAVWRVIHYPKTLALWLILAIGIGCRLLVVISPVLFDDDVHRYLWDGNVLAHGVNPYRYAPLADEISTLRDENWTRVGYPQIRTIYPPLAECFFAGAWLLGIRTTILLKAFFLLFDIANMLWIVLLLQRIRRPIAWSIVYAWSPLAVKEFANSGHLEPVLLFFMLLTMILLLREKPGWRGAGICWGLAILTKFAPVLWAPLLWRMGRRRIMLPAMLLIAAFYLPFLGAGRHLFSGAVMYSRYWNFNSVVFALQQAAIPGAGQLPLNPLRVLVAVLMLGYAIYAARRAQPDDRRAWLATCGNVLTACLLLSPIVDPWYLCWLLPFLCCTPNVGLLLWTVTCQLSYLYYAHHTFPAWIYPAEYLPVVLIMLSTWIARKRHTSQRAQGESAILHSEPSQI